MSIDRALWVRIWPLLEAGRDVDPAARNTWIGRLDLDEDARRALRRAMADRSLIEAAKYLEAGPVGYAPPAADPAPGITADARLGAYRLVREIGRGGMSVVWLAERDDGHARRRVAIKIPHAGPGQDGLAARLRRECDLLAGLEHPNIARLYDVGVTPQGVPFLVMELVEGESIGDWCRARRLPIAARLRLFAQVLEAVQHAHTRLILHRDLKPSNILVTTDGCVRLVDFGIAKLLADDERDTTPLTAHGGRVLTPHYAAPEQILGERVGTATDVYALGVVLFELLTGERPYRLARASAAALEDAILSQEPRRPSDAWTAADAERAASFRATPARLRRALRGDLDLIVAKALSKRAERRYATAEAFASDIARHLATQPIAARPDGAGYRARKFVVRHAWGVAAGAALAIAIGAGVGGVVLQAEQTRREAAKATAIKDFLVGLFESNSVEQDDAARRRAQSVQALLERSAGALTHDLAAQPGVRVELEAVVARLLQDLALTDAAATLRGQRVELLEAAHAPLAERAQARLELAETEATRGDDAAARRALAAAVTECARGGDEPPFACLQVDLVRGLRAARAHDLEAARAAIEPAASAALRRDPGSALAADALAALAELRGTQNRQDEAYPLYRRSMEIRERLWGPRSVRLARERFALGNNLWAERRFVEAEAELRASLAAVSAALGPEHVNTALVELQLGRLQSWLRGEGQGHVQHAAAILAAHTGEISAENAFDAREALAETLLMDGRLSEASSAFAQVQAMPHPPGETADGAAIMEAVFLTESGRFDAARERLEALRERRARDLGASHPYVADAELRLGGVELAAGRLDSAQAAFERALRSQDAREQAYGSAKHGAVLGLASVELERGHFDRAWPAISQSDVEARKTPANEQYLTTRTRLDERVGRVLTGLGRAPEARPHFERALAAMSAGYPANPELAALRAHYAECLAQLHEPARAQEQLALAEQALREEPLAGPQYARAVEQARERVARRGVPS
jgi:serine/threonine-protein kinase